MRYKRAKKLRKIIEDIYRMVKFANYGSMKNIKDLCEYAISHDDADILKLGEEEPPK